MSFWGSWLTLGGSALVVVQSAWIIFSLKFRRDRLCVERKRAEVLEQREGDLAGRLKEGWGSEAVITNLEELPHFRPDPERDRLRAEWKQVSRQRLEAGWLYTWGHLKEAETSKARELRELEEDWRRTLRHGVPGMIGGVLALVGAVMLAIDAT